MLTFTFEKFTIKLPIGDAHREEVKRKKKEDFKNVTFVFVFKFVGGVND